MESKKKSALRVFYFLVAILFVAGANCWAVEQTLLIIGTGGITGVYYPAGGAIARLINKGTSVHGMRAIVESTGGSVYNINAIDSGQMQLAIVQSDWVYGLCFPGMPSPLL